jgi:hypothetical protein
MPCVYSYGARPPIDGLRVFEEQIHRGSRYRNALVEIERRRRDGVARVQREFDQLSALLLAIDGIEHNISEARKQAKLTHAGGRRKPRGGVTGDPARRASLREMIEELRRHLEVLKGLRGWAKDVFKVDPQVRAEFEMPAHVRRSPYFIRYVRPWQLLCMAIYAVTQRSAAMRLRCEYATVDESAAAEVRQARRVAGLSPGTYLLIEEAAQKWRKRGAPPPKFRRGDGTGRVGVQIQGGLSVAELLSGEDTRLRLSSPPQIPAPPEVTSTTSRRQRARAIAYGFVHFCRCGDMTARSDRRVLQIRVATGEQRTIVWASLPIVIHRELPTDGVIVNAWVQRRRLGARFVYEAQLVLRDDIIQPVTEPRRAMVAVDIGARDLTPRAVIVDGVSRVPTRVAIALDSDGVGGELVLPQERLSSPTSRGRGRRRLVPDALDKVHDLQAIRDQRQDEIRSLLAAYKVSAGAAAASPRPNPALDWLRERTQHLVKWRAPARFVMLLRNWQRHDGDQEIYESLNAHIRRDRHLSDWQRREERRHLLRRRDLFRVESARLARTYDLIVIAARDYRRETWVPEEAPSSQMHDSRVILRGAAPGEFRATLRQAAMKYGSRVLEIPLDGDTAWALDDRVCRRLLASAEAIAEAIARGEMLTYEEALARGSRVNHYGTEETFKKRRLGTDERIDPLAGSDTSL